MHVVGGVLWLMETVKTCKALQRKRVYIHHWNSLEKSTGQKSQKLIESGITKRRHMWTLSMDFGAKRMTLVQIEKEKRTVYDIFAGNTYQVKTGLCKIRPKSRID